MTKTLPLQSVGLDSQQASCQPDLPCAGEGMNTVLTLKKLFFLPLLLLVHLSEMGPSSGELICQRHELTLGIRLLIRTSPLVQEAVQGCQKGWGLCWPQDCSNASVHRIGCPLVLLTMEREHQRNPIGLCGQRDSESREV